MILGLYNNFLNSSFQLLQNHDLKEWTEISLQKIKKIRWSIIVREGGIFFIWDKVRNWVHIQILETKEKRKFRCRCLFFWQLPLSNRPVIPLSFSKIHVFSCFKKNKLIQGRNLLVQFCYHHVQDSQMLDYSKFSKTPLKI